MRSVDYDLCVVGAGMIGSSAARHASYVQGTRVCLLGPAEPQEQSRQPVAGDIFGSYYDEGRITRSVDPDPTWANLNALSKARYRQLERDSGVQFYGEIGCLLYGRQQGMYMTRLSRTADEQNIPVEKLAAKDLKERFPALHVSDEDVGILENNAGYVNPRRLVQAQQTVARQQGCHIISHVVDHVEEISQPDGSTVMQLTTGNGHVIRANRVLLATGAFTPNRQLLPDGLEADLDYKTQTVVLGEVSDVEAASLSYLACMSYDGTAYDELQRMDVGKFGIYYLPPIRYPNGKIYMKVGHGDLYEKSLTSKQAVTEWFCGADNSQQVAQLTKWLQNMFPAVNFLSFEVDTCVTSASRSGRPYIDLVHPRLGVALGGCGFAAKSCDEIGRMAADLILKGIWTHKMPKELFRFLPKKSVESRL